MIAVALAERVGRDPEDFEVRNFADALIAMSLGLALTSGTVSGRTAWPCSTAPSRTSRQVCRSDRSRPVPRCA